MTEPPEPPASPAGTRSLFVVAAVVGVGVLAWWFWSQRPQPTNAEGATYVPNAACAACHEAEQHHWEGSHHDLAMDVATEETVLGDFDDVTYDHFGQTTRFFRKDGRYFVHTAGRDGTPRDFEVKYTFGVTPLQQYLLETENGHLQCLQVSWDVQKKRWFHIQDEPIESDDALHWSGMQFQANFMCIECHVTGFDRGYDESTNSYASTWSDIDVGCQACHGPGSKHVAWAESHRARAGAEDPIGLAVRFKGAPADVQIEHCARCHARRNVVSEPYAHGKPFLQHYVPRLLVEPLYHADGQILDEVYVYGSFLQAKKHKRGVRCTDCHDPHSARLLAQGNDLCTRCHQENPPAEFPTIRKVVYDHPDHHFHKPGTPGSRCVDCHMDARTYMGVDPRRDHSFRIPRPDLSERIGTPNACNGCHDDKSAAWATAEIAKRFPAAAQRPHFGVAFAAARAGLPAALKPLESIAMDLEQPEIVRATAVHYLGRFDLRSAAPTVALLLGDEAPLIRATAVESFDDLFPRGTAPKARAQKAQLLAPLLRDDALLVRTEAARALADVPPSAFSPEDRTAFETALAEFVARQQAVRDRPGGQLNLAVLAEDQGDLDTAERHYRRAITLDPSFLPARFNLATLLNRRTRNDEAVVLLREITTLAPENGEGWYSLGLLLSEMGRMQDAVDALSEAVRRMPGRARIRYNLALALQQTDQKDAAFGMLQEAHKLAPGDANIATALILHLIEAGRLDEADALLRRLEARAPQGSRLPQDLRARLEAARGK